MKKTDIKIKALLSQLKLSVSIEADIPNEVAARIATALTMEIKDTPAEIEVIRTEKNRIPIDLDDQQEEIPLDEHQTISAEFVVIDDNTALEHKPAQIEYQEEGESQ